MSTCKCFLHRDNYKQLKFDKICFCSVRFILHPPFIHHCDYFLFFFFVLFIIKHFPTVVIHDKVH